MKYVPPGQPGSVVSVEPRYENFIGREDHQMMLDHYSQTKNLLVDYSSKPLGFF